MARLAGELRAGTTGDGSNTPDSPGAPQPSSRIGNSTPARRRVVDILGQGTNADAVPQFDTAANPKLTNAEFTGGQGWSTSGDVAIANGAAVLTESATAQTRLSQTFVINPDDKYLRFTLSDIALDNVNAAPDDAFEVALIDANTGLSLLGGTGLTHSDAFINLQADGSEHLASGIVRTTGADGSRTYRIDLTGLAAGTVASLSFDLIGFGRGTAATSSHVTVRDMSLGLGVPELADDAATTAEDTTVTIDALANDLNATQPGFAPVIVTTPAHGQVTVNLDGSFGPWMGEMYQS
jgi:hypothetical protein